LVNVGIIGPADDGHDEQDGHPLDQQKALLARLVERVAAPGVAHPRLHAVHLWFRELNALSTRAVRARVRSGPCARRFYGVAIGFVGGDSKGAHFQEENSGILHSTGPDVERNLAITERTAS
jgi:hypothetical protein